MWHYHKSLAFPHTAGPFLRLSKIFEIQQREPGSKINRGFVRTVLLHLNSARSGDTQRRQSYSSPAKRGRGAEEGEVWPCTRLVLINVMWLWQSAPTNSSTPWYSCLLRSMRQIHLITWVSSRGNGAGCRRGALGGSTSSEAARRVSGLYFLSAGRRYTERPSSLFACNITRAAGQSVTAVIM